MDFSTNSFSYAFDFSPKLVASTGIEPVSGASETLILSIVRRGLNAGFNIFFRSQSCYLMSPGTLLLKIFTAIASKITPKNLRTAIIPPGPRAFSIKFRDFRTI
jgi:hypothetical protein